MNAIANPDQVRENAARQSALFDVLSAVINGPIRQHLDEHITQEQRDLIATAEAEFRAKGLTDAQLFEERFTANLSFLMQACALFLVEGRQVRPREVLADLMEYLGPKLHDEARAACPVHGTPDQATPRVQ